jgi:hypothetical protein
MMALPSLHHPIRTSSATMLRRPRLLWMTAALFQARSCVAAAKTLETFIPNAIRKPARSVISSTAPSRLPAFSGNTCRRQWMTTDSSDASSDAAGKEDDYHIRENTQAWLKRVVIGMNLCPFAERPSREGKLKIEVIRGNDEEVINAHILTELIKRQDSPGTTLLVCPECYPDDFEDYLGMVSWIENDLMVEHDLAEKVQIAPFHPLFQFEGSGLEAVDNWTNRSPYPIFHVLREEEVTKAVDMLDGDAGKVWKRNVNLLHALEDELGSEAVQRVMQGQADADEKVKSQAILRRFKLQLGSVDRFGADDFDSRHDFLGFPPR